VSAALGSADGIVEPPVPQAEPVYLGRHALCSGCMLLTPSSEGGGLSADKYSNGMTIVVLMYQQECHMDWISDGGYDSKAGSNQSDPCGMVHTN